MYQHLIIYNDLRIYCEQCENNDRYAIMTPMALGSYNVLDAVPMVAQMYDTIYVHLVLYKIYNGFYDFSQAKVMFAIVYECLSQGLLVYAMSVLDCLIKIESISKTVFLIKNRKFVRRLHLPSGKRLCTKGSLL